MRRWILWTSLAVVLVVALVFGLTQIPSTTPYRFLRGRTPVSVNTTSLDARLADGIDYRVTAYTFRADYGPLRKEADRELKAKGLVEDGMQSGSGDGPTYFYGPDAKHPFSRRVSLYKDAKYEKIRQGSLTYSAVVHEQPGWVTVVVEGPEDDPTLLESFRSWLGF